jgi:ABC-type sugar transport system permease subunit
MFAPSLALIGLFSYYPAIHGLIGGFTSWDGFGPSTYVGLQEFRTYVTSTPFLAEVRNVFLLIGGTIVINIASQFTAAEVVARLGGRFHNFIKYALALPMVIPLVVVVDIWAYFYTPEGGVIDTAFHAFGLPNVDWLGSPTTALLAILLIGFPWVSNLGFLIFLGGIQRLPTEVREAASLDGASVLRRVWSVDVPMLRPQFRVVIVLSAIFAVQNFIPILLLTQGGPGNSTMVPGLDMYQQAFQGDQYGLGMAIGSLMFVLMLVMTLIGGAALRNKT